MSSYSSAPLLNFLSEKAFSLYPVPYTSFAFFFFSPFFSLLKLDRGLLFLSSSFSALEAWQGNQNGQSSSSLRSWKMCEGKKQKNWKSWSRIKMEISSLVHFYGFHFRKNFSCVIWGKKLQKRKDSQITIKIQCILSVEIAFGFRYEY